MINIQAINTDPGPVGDGSFGLPSLSRTAILLVVPVGPGPVMADLYAPKSRVL